MQVLLTGACLVYFLPAKDSEDKWGLGKLVLPPPSGSAAPPSSSHHPRLALRPSPFHLFQLPVEWESPLPSRAMFKVPFAGVLGVWPGVPSWSERPRSEASEGRRVGIP